MAGDDGFYEKARALCLEPVFLFVWKKSSVVSNRSLRAIEKNHGEISCRSRRCFDFCLKEPKLTSTHCGKNEGMPISLSVFDLIPNGFPFKLDDFRVHSIPIRFRLVPAQRSPEERNFTDAALSRKCREKPLRSDGVKSARARANGTLLHSF